MLVGEFVFFFQEDFWWGGCPLGANHFMSGYSHSYRGCIPICGNDITVVLPLYLCSSSYNLLFIVSIYIYILYIFIDTICFFSIPKYTEYITHMKHPSHIYIYITHRGCNSHRSTRLSLATRTRGWSYFCWDDSAVQLWSPSGPRQVERPWIGPRKRRFKYARIVQLTWWLNMIKQFVTFNLKPECWLNYIDGSNGLIWFNHV